MKYKETSELLHRIDGLIRRCATGTPDELCHKLQIAKSTWHELKRTMMEEFNCPIAYCKFRQSYYYTEIGKFEPPQFVKDK